VLNNQAYAYCINFMLDGPNHLFICCETAAVNASAYRLHEYRYVVIDLKYRQQHWVTVKNGFLCQ